MKNIFVIGEKQVGKSTLINKALRETDAKYSGFLTLPFFIDGERRGYYLHGISGISSEENDVPITVQPDGKSFYPVVETFNALGVKILNQSLKDNSKIIVMDEIGIAEGSSESFIKAISTCLDGKKPVLGVLKAKDCRHINDIKNRSDTIVYELNQSNRDKAFQDILQKVRSML